MKDAENFLVAIDYLKTSADEAEAKKQAALEGEAVRQLEGISETCKVAAKNGYRSVYYNKPIGEIALEILKSKGYKVLDYGGGVTNSYELSGW